MWQDKPIGEEAQTCGQNFGGRGLYFLAEVNKISELLIKANRSESSFRPATS